MAAAALCEKHSQRVGLLYVYTAAVYLVMNENKLCSTAVCDMQNEVWNKRACTQLAKLITPEYIILSTHSIVRTHS